MVAKATGPAQHFNHDPKHYGMLIAEVIQGPHLYGSTCFQNTLYPSSQMFSLFWQIPLSVYTAPDILQHENYFYMLLFLLADISRIIHAVDHLFDLLVFC